SCFQSHRLSNGGVVGSRSAHSTTGQGRGCALAGAVVLHYRCRKGAGVLAGLQHMTGFLEWCQTNALSQLMNSAKWTFPAVEIFHIAGLVVIFGSMMVLNLRIF